MSTSTGKLVEQKVAEWLEGTQGWRHIDSNWSDDHSEIDLILIQKQTAHFVEVKYRRHASAGEGYAYVNKTKRHKLVRGAQAWIVENEWQGNMQVDVVSVSGPTDNLNFKLYENAVTVG